VAISMKKSVVVLLHILYWLRLPPIVFSVITGHITMDAASVFYQILPTLSNLLAFYFAYFLLFPYLLARKKVIAFILGSIATLTFVYWLAWSVFRSLHGYYDFSALPESVTQVSRYSFALYFGEVLSGYIAGCLLKAFITWYSDIRVREGLKQKQMQAELSLLKAQLNPHFLFNTLNNIDTMILKSPEKASQYLNKLSDMLRFSLYESSDENILLSTEIDYIRKYIDLESIRTNNSKFVSFQVNGDPGGLQVVPLLFIPFIENAFKHTPGKKTDHAIEIVITISNREILFRCSNIVAGPSEKAKTGGLGMEIIKSRLVSHYPRHTLEVQLIEGRYTVVLKLS
jgi:two-component system, LytTR family, sensor kinase